MTPEERNLISSLFDRLRKADTAPKDGDAEAFIRQKVAEFPSAPYLLVQSVLVLEHAVSNAQARIADLEKQLAEANQNQKASHGGGFLSGLFGGGRHEEQTPPPPPQSQPAAPRPAYAPPPPQPLYSAPPPTPYPSTTNLQPGAGGSFLKGALATAAGVAGGAVLAQGIENLIGHHAGPFGSVLGGGQGGFLPGDVQQPAEVTNIYNVNEDPQGVQNAQDFDSGDQGGVADQNVDYNPGQDANFDSVDDTFDDGGGGGGDDTSFV